MSTSLPSLKVIENMCTIPRIQTIQIGLCAHVKKVTFPIHLNISNSLLLALFSK